MCANISDTRAMSSMMAACKKCARSLSKKSYIQSMLVRYLIEASIDHVSHRRCKLFLRNSVAQWIACLTHNWWVLYKALSSNFNKGSQCFMQQENLPSLHSTGLVPGMDLSVIGINRIACSSIEKTTTTKR